MRKGIELGDGPKQRVVGDGAARLRYQLIDEGTGRRETVVAASPDWPTASADGETNWVRGIEAGDRRWALAGRPTERFLSEHRSRQPLALGLAALLLWETLGGLLLVVSRHARSTAQRERDRIVAAALGSRSEGVVVADRDGRFLLFNTAAERMVGMGSMEKEPASWPETYGCFLPDGMNKSIRDEENFFHFASFNKAASGRVL